MAFWSTQRVKHEQAAQTLLEPFSPDHLHQGAYELTLSQQAVTTTAVGEESGVPGQPRAFVIAPGQFAILYTREEARIPANVIAFISVKSSYKADGLINISGFHVDPGYQGRLRFSVYNAGPRPVVLKLGDPTFQIWFAEMDEATEDPYQGNHQRQSGLTSGDLAHTREKPASPAVLAQRVGELELKLNHLSTMFYAVLAALCVGILVTAAGSLLNYLQTSAAAAAKQAAPGQSAPAAKP